MGSLSLPELPVIDFSKENLKPGKSSWLSTCKDVMCALEEYGCFVAVYDKVPLKLHNDLVSTLKDLFDLPLETKRKNVSDLPYYGYVGNQPFIPSLYEGMGIDNAITLEGAEDFADTMWPGGNDHFCKTVLSYSIQISELEKMVVRMVFESYGVYDHHHDSHKESTTYLLRMMKYRVPEKTEANVGCDAHTDKSFITVLHQNEVSGLEVKSKDGQWMSFTPSPSSFIVIAGDALLAWSNERINAPFHRVVMSESEPRYSVGLFSFIKGMIEVPEKLVDEKNPLRFKPFENFGLLRYFLTEEGREKESAIKAYCGV
ncbi:2-OXOGLUTARATE-DEPENDENT DIOXYGENASE AOP3-LIKE [Salix purpurea]|uniref:2-OXOGLUTARATE-DEPENDENT DIOXYGENASE AOP3-LIKE n=1 Tax=Salix purpurea TaxID=77065 RepID=A0A9Q0THP9_SALPP|nr:2-OXOGLUTARATE-DEPENDENT DIOXYGENASE AOP3-LIKE [Salix purpurea]